MTQRLPLLMELGADKAGLQIGYAVMELDYTEYSPFTVDDVIETDTPGTYVVVDGYAAPDEGGYVVVYESDGGDPPVLTPVARGSIPSAMSVLAGTQPDVTFGDVVFGQVKIVATIENEGALHIVNAHPSGAGTHSSGRIGQYNEGTEEGQYNSGGASGQRNAGGTQGQYNTGLYGQRHVGSIQDVVGLDSQAVRNSMGFAPSFNGAPAAGSIDAHLDDILEDTATALPATLAALPTDADVQVAAAAALTAYDPPTKAELNAAVAQLLGDLAGATVTVVSAVEGGRVTVYVADTWRFTVASDQLDLTSYEALGLVVKRHERQTDAQALLYLRSDTGLARIGGAAPASAGNGTLTAGTSSFTAVVHVAETRAVAVKPGDYTWWLKGFDTSATPDEAVTVATGSFVVVAAGLSAVV